MDHFWVKCGHCGAGSSVVTTTQLYLTTCGHFSCSHCLSQAPIPKPPTSGYCYVCKKPCAVVNLSQKDKLSSDVAFYFQDPGPLLQKMVEVYNFQKVHQQRKFENELKFKLIQDIECVRAIRERAQVYLPFYGRIYEFLNAKFGVKPSNQYSNFSSTEIDGFIAECVKIKQELDSASRKGKVDSYLDLSRADRCRTPSLSPQCTPRQTPVGGALTSCYSSMASIRESGGKGDRNSQFRTRVQSEMRSGGVVSGGNGHSQNSTPAGSVCSKPSPLLADQRMSQQLPTPGSATAGKITNPYLSRGGHPSSLLTPPSSGRIMEQGHLLTKETPIVVRQTPSLFPSHQTSIETCPRPTSVRHMGSRGWTRSATSSSYQLPQGVRPGSYRRPDAGMALHRRPSVSPQPPHKEGSVSPMSVGGTPAPACVALGRPCAASVIPPNTSRSIGLSRGSNIPEALCSSVKPSSVVGGPASSRMSACPGSSVALASGDMSSASQYSNKLQLNMSQARLSVPRRLSGESRMSTLLPPPPLPPQSVVLHSVPRKPFGSRSAHVFTSTLSSR